MIYITSDTHFNHKRILEFERKQFVNIDTHNDTILKEMERVLKKDDILYHLGDVGHFSQEVFDRLKALPCKKILIKGNHDKSNHYFGAFNRVSNTPIFLKERVLLSHYPLPVSKGMLNIHGHIHSGMLASKNHINANIHHCDYKLLTEKQLLKWLGMLPRDNWKFQQEWYSDLEKKYESNEVKVNEFPINKRTN